MAFPTAAAAADDLQETNVVADFLGQFCLDCHDSGSAEGDREFGKFRTTD